MKKAYIILAHKNIEQLIRLLERLNEDQSYFFIHIDKKMSDDELLALSSMPYKIQMVERINAEWAGFSLVEATLQLMKAVKETNRNFDAVILLSGQDYPVKSNSYINQFFRDTDKPVQIEYFNIPNYEKWSPRGGLYRVDKYFFGFKSYQRFISRALNFLGNHIPFIKRKQPGNLKPYAGSQWWTMDMYALDYILKFVNNNPHYTTFHKATFAPDEVFFQTILLNAKDKRIINSIDNNNRRYIRWGHADKPHPELLQKEDLQPILHSGALFARKLDLDQYPEIFDLIDRHCLGVEAAVA